jgi:hypothetical protein
MERRSECGGSRAAGLGRRERRKGSPSRRREERGSSRGHEASQGIHARGRGRWKTARQGDGCRLCMFKDVMGCPGMHPPWHCKVFGKLPAKEREKIIKDNRLCPFCLLHDKDKPCGAKQKPVACTASNCKGRHIQKLHDFLKDVFREESLVHVVQEDDGWEESEEAWELGEEEMMIVGTVQQEDDCSWQDASKSWLEQDVKGENETCQVGTCQCADGTTLEAGKEAGQRGKVETEEGGWWAPGPDDLLIEGEEGEYFLELLMRETPPGEPRATSSGTDRSVEREEDPRGKTAPTKGKWKKKGKKKVLKGSGEAAAQPEGEKAGGKEEGEGKASRASKQGKETAPDPLINPEAKGRGLTGSGQAVTELGARSTTTSRGECSGQEKPGS